MCKPIIASDAEDSISKRDVNACERSEMGIAALLPMISCAKPVRIVPSKIICNSVCVVERLFARCIPDGEFTGSFERDRIGRLGNAALSYSLQWTTASTCLSECQRGAVGTALVGETSTNSNAENFRSHQHSRTVEP